MEKRNLIVLFLILLIGLVGWYSFIYSAQQGELQVVTAQLNDFNLKVGQARRAQSDIKAVETRFQEESMQLENERARFIKKNELSKVTSQMESLARRHNLRLEDFSPSMENYFETNPDAKISALPVEITISGLFLDLGKFIEEWPQLPFYILPHSMTIEKKDVDGSLIKARIVTKLYTWNN